MPHNQKWYTDVRGSHTEDFPKSGHIYGHKIPLLELREKLLVKQEKYIRICNASISDKELLQLAWSVGYRLSPSISVEMP